MTVAAISSSLLFNLTTNGNGQLLRERLAGVVEDPALLGALLACVYVVASFAQVAIGLLIDRYPLKRLYIGVVLLQAPLFMIAAGATGWTLFVLQIAFMIAVFGAIPFTDAMIVRFVDDRIRSRVSGMRLFVSFGVSSAAVWFLGPIVKAAGFGALLWLMAGVAATTLVAVAFLPAAKRRATWRRSARRRCRRNRVAQQAEDAGRRGDHFVRAEEIAAAGEVADAAPGFGDEQRAGRDIPCIEAGFPEAVEAARRDVREVERAGAGAANARALWNQRVQHRQVGGHAGAAARRKHGADQRVLAGARRSRSGSACRSAARPCP